MRLHEERLRAQGAQVIVVVSHLTGACEDSATNHDGHSHEEVAECKPTGEIGRLLSELPPGTIDVLIAGHAHTVFAHRISDTFVLESNCRGQMIGRLDLVVGRDGVLPDASVIHEPWDLIHTATDPGCGEGEYDLQPQQIGDRMVTPSETALALVRTLEEESGSLCDESGCNANYLERSRQRESAVGNFAADAILNAFPTADVAIQNSGGLRADLPDGQLRREHIQTLMPFDNRLVTVKMTGKNLDLLLQIGSSGAHGIMQVAGATYHFDPDKKGGTDLNGDGTIDTWETRRLCSAQVAGEPIDPERIYEVATSDFIFGGGDHMQPALKAWRSLQRASCFVML